jgi:hypothetical protein
MSTASKGQRRGRAKTVRHTAYTYVNGGYGFDLFVSIVPLPKEKFEHGQQVRVTIERCEAGQPRKGRG